MSTSRTPIQIILIEQVFHTILLMIGWVLYIKYGLIIIVKSTLFSSEIAASIFISGQLIPLFLWFYLWIPYTSIRIWRASTRKPMSGINYAYKTYSCFVFIALTVSGISGLPALIEIIQELKNQ